MTPDCRCPDRKHAEAQGLLVRAPALGCWVDKSPDRAVRANGYGYLWVECPWCRGDLPSVPKQHAPNGDTWTAWQGEE